MHTLIPAFLIAGALSVLVVAGAPWVRRLRDWHGWRVWEVQES